MLLRQAGSDAGEVEGGIAVQFELLLEGLARHFADHAHMQHRPFYRVLAHLVIEVDAEYGLIGTGKLVGAVQVSWFEHGRSPSWLPNLLPPDRTRATGTGTSA